MKRNSSLLLVLISLGYSFFIHAQKPARHSLSVGVGAGESAFSNSAGGFDALFRSIGFVPAFQINYDYYLRRNLCVGASVSGQFIGAWEPNDSIFNVSKNLAVFAGITAKVFLWKGLYAGLDIGGGLGVSHTELELRALSNLAVHQIVTFGNQEVYQATSVNDDPFLQDKMPFVFENVGGATKDVISPILFSRLTIGYKVPLSKSWAFDVGLVGMLGYRLNGGENLYIYSPYTNPNTVLVEQTTPFEGIFENISTGEILQQQYVNGGFSVVDNPVVRKWSPIVASPIMDFNLGANVSVSYKF